MLRMSNRVSGRVGSFEGRKSMRLNLSFRVLRFRFGALSLLEV